MARFREILKNKNFSFLWLSQVISQFGDRLDQMALIALVAQRAPGSAFQLAKIVSFTILPVFLIGPIAGVYVDRWNRRSTMIACDLLRSLLVFFIAFVFVNSRSLVPIYVIIFLVFSITRFYVPAKLSVVPDLVKKTDLLLANSLVNTTGMIAAILGFGLGGVLVAMVGVKGGFYLDSFSFLVSGIMIIFISSKVGVIIHRARIFELGREVLEVIKKSVISEIKDGIVYLIKQRGIRLIVNIFFLLGAVAGTMYVVMIVFIQQTFGTVTKDLGLFVMFFGFGLFAGSLLYGRFGQATSHIKTIFLSLFSAGILLSLFTFILNTTPNFFIAAILSFLFGVVIAPILTAGNTLIHRVSSDEMRGKVFSNLEIVMHLAFLIFMLISSKLAEYIDRFWILLILGIICAIIGLIGLFNTKRVRTAYD